MYPIQLSGADISMRRVEREIIDRKDLEEIINRAHVCRLGMINGDTPYVVPLNFGYRNGTFYFHSAREGQKFEILQRGHKVCIEIDEGVKLVTAETPCDWDMHYACIIAYGIPRFIEDPVAKREALALIMARYSDKICVFQESAIAATAVFTVDIETMTGKQNQ
jgi:nitroimidazol reductase NimA-like FMN-containing flavoprotein (pyridoxamine 5'-phosphate oxidase superfamily)